MITYSVESWASYYPECITLWQEHYDEFYPVHQGKMAMAPDVDFFANADRSGQLQILVARDDGVMIGYCLVVIRPHVHYCGTICGFEDSYFLTKAYRKGLTGVRLISQSIKLLRQHGVKKVFFMTKEFISIARILEYCGLEKCDSVYSGWLED